MVFENQCWKGNLEKIKVLASGGIIRNGLSMSNIYPFMSCSLNVSDNNNNGYF